MENFIPETWIFKENPKCPTHVISEVISFEANGQQYSTLTISYGQSQIGNENRISPWIIYDGHVIAHEPNLPFKNGFLKLILYSTPSDRFRKWLSLCAEQEN